MCAVREDFSSRLFFSFLSVFHCFFRASCVSFPRLLDSSVFVQFVRFESCQVFDFDARKGPPFIGPNPQSSRTEGPLCRRGKKSAQKTFSLSLPSTKKGSSRQFQKKERGRENLLLPLLSVSFPPLFCCHSLLLLLLLLLLLPKRRFSSLFFPYLSPLSSVATRFFFFFFASEAKAKGEREREGEALLALRAAAAATEALEESRNERRNWTGKSPANVFFFFCPLPPLLRTLLVGEGAKNGRKEAERSGREKKRARVRAKEGRGETKKYGSG